MAASRSWTKSLFVGLWTILNVSRKVFFNLIFLFLFGFIIIALMQDDDKPTVPAESALVLNLKGDLVIQKYQVDPLDEFMREAFDQKEERPEVLMQDVLFAIDNAKHDKRIQTLVLDLSGLFSAGLDKLQQVADAIQSFKESGKPVYAVGDFYSQNQYYLAAQADKIYLNPMGGLLIEGYGRYRTYYKSAIEKLKAKTHVFRVGTYKSFVEPYIRDDMSQPAKEANLAWLNNLWGQYKQGIMQARDIKPGSFDEKLDDFLGKFELADGDFAQYALQNGWVDALTTREQIRSELGELVGSDDTSRGYKHITYKNYLSVIKPPFAASANGEQVAVVVAKGSILNGNQKPGEIGGDSTARLLRRARLNENVKAVVLYVDSPGGSAFASEIIRQEIDLLKAEGKPVVAAMSTLAASGGYWISASADKIIAAPSTITGSIGVFGMLFTFEDTLAQLGLHSDGVATTEMAGISVTRALDPRVGNILQRGVEKSYDQFISLVANERDLSKQAVDNIAQGRVWIGETALELGLVDELGYLNTAITSAAELAELERYDTLYIERELSPSDKFFKEMFGKGAAWLMQSQVTHSDSPLVGLVKQVLKEFDSISKLNDPKGIYAYCLACEG